MIDPVTGWFELAQYDGKKRNLSQTQLKLRSCLDTIDQQKSCMNKDNNLLVAS